MGNSNSIMIYQVDESGRYSGRVNSVQGEERWRFAIYTILTVFHESLHLVKSLQRSEWGEDYHDVIYLIQYYYAQKMYDDPHMMEKIELTFGLEQSPIDKKTYNGILNHVWRYEIRESAYDAEPPLKNITVLPELLK